MKKKIEIACIIDDDDIYVYGVRKLIQLKQLCENLMVFGNGQEALNYLKPIINTPDLLPEIILLDINMPVMDGWQFIEEFTKLHSNPAKKVTIYMISSSVNPRDVERAEGISGISKYIIKPITLDTLINIFQPVSVN
jgi:CheY-like chemotaxis protein